MRPRQRRGLSHATQLWLYTLLQLPLPAMLGLLLSHGMLGQRPMGIALALIFLLPLIALLGRSALAPRLVRGLLIMAVLQWFVLPVLFIGFLAVWLGFTISEWLPWPALRGQGALFIATLTHATIIMLVSLAFGYQRARPNGGSYSDRSKSEIPG